MRDNANPIHTKKGGATIAFWIQAGLHRQQGSSKKHTPQQADPVLLELFFHPVPEGMRGALTGFQYNITHETIRHGHVSLASKQIMPLDVATEV